MKAVFKTAIPYADDALNLPVGSVDGSIPHYVDALGFEVVSREQAPFPRVILARDLVRIGLAENGGDPTQEGCVFEVDDIDAAFREINGRPPKPGDIQTRRKMSGESQLAFFHVAPDGLCFMIVQPT